MWVSITFSNWPHTFGNIFFSKQRLSRAQSKDLSIIRKLCTFNELIKMSLRVTSMNLALCVVARYVSTSLSSRTQKIFE